MAALQCTKQANYGSESDRTRAARLGLADDGCCDQSWRQLPLQQLQQQQELQLKLQPGVGFN